MKIGLVRHFKVTYTAQNSWMTADQFNQWVEAYNQSDVYPSANPNKGQAWDICISSDLLRAVATAEQIYQGPVVTTDQLREIKMNAVNQSNIKLHYNLWLLMGRVAWYFSHKSQAEGRMDTQLRAQQVINRIEDNYKDANVLVVSHGAFMKELTDELIRRGYRGKGFIKPENGKLYVYSR
ncbi:phosphoglycerate mutase [Paenibacillus selenitireducens]|uniref:Phosphoglycerate mutase n=1 Tax=Paenibacillus selenitireducens TaxID=1324314 RepID=A0A1T2X1M3_9BACL|nr:histidine phosphatase family protein [Paenibacillus selenitireducens]OPA73764.1 phosphoglycerate mutase [Paenibacillus selenitireducens]